MFISISIIIQSTGRLYQHNVILLSIFVDFFWVYFVVVLNRTDWPVTKIKYIFDMVQLNAMQIEATNYLTLRRRADLFGSLDLN